MCTMKKKEKLPPEVAKSLLCRALLPQQFFMGPILFMYYEESLVSSHMNLKLPRFLSVRPNIKHMIAKPKL